jgi:hypothetical protein
MLRAIHPEDLLRELPLLRIQFAGLTSPRFPHLGPQLKLLSEFFEDSATAYLRVSRQRCGGRLL